MTRQTGIRSEIFYLQELGAGRRFGHYQALTHVKVSAKLIELAASLAGEAPRHHIITWVAVAQEFITIFVVAIE
jgi:hypothetical protein